MDAVMIDANEPAWVQGLDFGGIAKAVAPLEAGDLWATAGTDLLCFERKTPSDLLASIRDGRLFKQAMGMRERTPWAYVVVTGLLAPDAAGNVTIDGKPTNWGWASLQGALIDVQEAGAHVVYCGSNRDYEDAILTIGRRRRSREKIVPPAVQPRVMSNGEILLTCLPGIGPEKARSILVEFDNNVAYALSWLTWKGTLIQLGGIGDGIKDNVRRFLNLRDGEELLVATPEYTEFTKSYLKHTRDLREKQTV